MSTAKRVVNRSLRWLGIDTQFMPASPETVVDQFDNFIGFLNELEANGICIPGLVIPTEIDDELSEPAWATIGLETNLAIYGSALFQITEISDRLAKAAKSSQETILSQTIKIPILCMPNTMPVGAGNDWFPRNRVFFPKPLELGEEGCGG